MKNISTLPIKDLWTTNQESIPDRQMFQKWICRYRMNQFFLWIFLSLHIKTRQIYVQFTFKWPLPCLYLRQCALIGYALLTPSTLWLMKSVIKMYLFFAYIKRLKKVSWKYKLFKFLFFMWKHFFWKNWIFTI